MTGIESFAAQAVSGLAVPIFQILWGGGGKVLGIFGKTLDEKTREMIFAASKQYVQNYEESPENKLGNAHGKTAHICQYIINAC
ncbi:hypothetical protein [Nostoc sp.]|uniref:hypothetical protein n=1 Tax=Nostoc sp. TaxID=1180 RepID=UPI002FF0B258